MSDSRFDYIEWDNQSQYICDRLKSRFKWLETLIDEFLQNSREKSSAITKLEEAFMWVGKAIRADQLKRQKDDGTLPLPQLSPDIDPGREKE